MSQSKSVGTVLPEEKPPFAQQPAFNKTPEPKRKPGWSFCCSVVGQCLIISLIPLQLIMGWM